MFQWFGTFAFVEEMTHDSNIHNLKQKLSCQFDFCMPRKNIVSLKLLILGTQLLIPHLLIMCGTPTLCLAFYLSSGDTKMYKRITAPWDFPLGTNKSV